MKQKPLVVLSLSLSFFLLVSCSKPNGERDRPIYESPTPLQFETCETFRDSYAESAIETYIYSLNEERSWNSPTPFLFTDFPSETNQITYDTLKNSHYVGNGPLVTQGDTSYIAVNNKIKVLQTWPPQEIKELTSINLEDYLRTYKQKFVDVSSIVPLFRSKSGDSFVNPSSLAEEKADQIGLVSLTLVNKYLVAFVSIYRSGKWAPNSISNLIGIDQGTRVLVFDTSGQSLTLKSITDHPGFFTPPKKIGANIRSSLTIPFSERLDLLYLSSYGESIRDDIFNTHIGLDISYNEEVSLPVFDEKANRQIRYAAWEMLEKKLTPEMLSKALPHKYELDKDLRPITEEKLFQCNSLVSQPYETDAPLTTVVSIEENGGNLKLDDFNDAFIGRVYGVQQTEDKLLLATSRFVYPLRDDLRFDTVVDFIALSSDSKFDFKQYFEVKGNLLSNYLPYSASNDSLFFFSEQDRSRSLHVEKYSKSGEDYVTSESSKKSLKALSFNVHPNYRYILGSSNNQSMERPLFLFHPSSKDFLLEKEIITNAHRIIPVSEKFMLTLDFAEDRLALFDITLDLNHPTNTITGDFSPLLTPEYNYYTTSNSYAYFNSIKRFLLPYESNDTSPSLPLLTGYSVFSIDPTSGGVAWKADINHTKLFNVTCDRVCRWKRDAKGVPYDAPKNRGFFTFLFSGDTSKKLTEPDTGTSNYIYTFSIFGVVISDIDGAVQYKLEL